MRTFDPKDINVLVGRRALTGFAENTFVTAERAEDMFTEHIGAKGEVSMSETSNNSGEITVTLANTSPDVRYLNNLANKKGPAAIVAVQIVDLNDNTVVSGTEARVRRPANYEGGKEITEREFVIFVSELNFD